MIELVSRAIEPFPLPVRTLDALHLASLLYLAAAGQRVRLATFDARMQAAADVLGIASVLP